MNENDSAMVSLRVGKRYCQFNEIRCIEGYEHPVLLSRQLKQLGVLKHL